MAVDIGIGLRTLQRAIAELVRLEEIETVRRGPTSSLYNLRRHKRRPQRGGSFGGSSQIPLFTENTSLESPTQSESTDQESSAIECESAEQKALKTHVAGCGIKPTEDLIKELDRKARFYGVTGFRIAAAIDRAWRKVEGTSNVPRGPGWILAVVENELKEFPRSGHGAGSSAGRAPDSTSGGRRFESAPVACPERADSETSGVEESEQESVQGSEAAPEPGVKIELFCRQRTGGMRSIGELLRIPTASEDAPRARCRSA